MKSLLLTGAAGFIGRHVVSELAGSDFAINALVLPSDPALPPQDNLHFHEVDLFDYARQEDVFRKVRPTHLLHLAWYTAHGKYWTSAENPRWVQCSLELARNFAKYGGKRAVFAGTCAEYDWSSPLLSEASTPTVPATLYGSCKNALRQIIGAYAPQAGFGWAWGRIFLLYGPFEHPDRFVPSVIRAIIRSQAAKCTAGTQVRDYLHVEDVASAFVALLKSPVQGPVNIASGRPIAIREIATLIAGQLGRPELLKLGALPARPDEPERLIADTQRLLEEVVWKPKHTIESGLEQVIAWWKEREGKG